VQIHVVVHQRKQQHPTTAPAVPCTRSAYRPGQSCGIIKLDASSSALSIVPYAVRHKIEIRIANGSSRIVDAISGNTSAPVPATCAGSRRSHRPGARKASFWLTHVASGLTPSLLAQASCPTFTVC
jgi:hypothetical protein